MTTLSTSALSTEVLESALLTLEQVHHTLRCLYAPVLVLVSVADIA